MKISMQFLEVFFAHRFGMALSSTLTDGRPCRAARKMDLPQLTASLTLEDPSGMEPVAWTPRGEHEVRFAGAEKRIAARGVGRAVPD